MSDVCFFYKADSTSPTAVSLPPGLIPTHKASIMMFLERVYGIEDQATFFRILEDAILPDLRAATTLDIVWIITSVIVLFCRAIFIKWYDEEGLLILFLINFFISLTSAMTKVSNHSDITCKMISL